MPSDEILTVDLQKLTFSGDAARSLLIVDDDAPFRIRLARAMERRGFDVVAVDSVALGIEVAQPCVVGRGLVVVPSAEEDVQGSAVSSLFYDAGEVQAFPRTAVAFFCD